MKIVHIIGARPQFIKYCPVSQAIETINNDSGGKVKDLLVHTGQHYDYTMSKIFFDELGIKNPDYHLGVGSGTHGEQTGRIIQKVEEVLIQENPDIVLVYGDTNSTLGAALAAAKLHIPLAHVEAGLRSYNKSMPEEINRILVDDVSTILFCPSVTAVRILRDHGYKNILDEGRLFQPDGSLLDSAAVPAMKSDKNNPLVINVGDVMYDVILYAVELAQGKSKILQELNLMSKEYCLLTMHRAENTDHQEKFEKMIRYVNEIFEGRKVIFPMHPRTRKTYLQVRTRFHDNIRIIDSVGYFDILTLLNNSSLLATDSGGMQKEAYWLKVPCVTLRDETEWTETIESGWNVLYRDYTGRHRHSDEESTFYGDGRASQRIVKTIVNLQT